MTDRAWVYHRTEAPKIVEGEAYQRHLANGWVDSPTKVNDAPAASVEVPARLVVPVSPSPDNPGPSPDNPPILINRKRGRPRKVT